MPLRRSVPRPLTCPFRHARRAAAALCGVLVLASAGCSGSDEPSAAPTSTTPATTAPASTTSTEPIPTTTLVTYPDDATLEQKLAILTALGNEGLCGLWQARNAMSPIATETSAEFEAKMLASVAQYNLVADVVADESEVQAEAIRSAIGALAARAEAEGYPVTMTQGPVPELNEQGFLDGVITFDRIAAEECATPAD